MKAKLKMAPHCNVNLDPLSGVCPAAHSAQKDQMEVTQDVGQRLEQDCLLQQSAMGSRSRVYPGNKVLLTPGEESKKPGNPESIPLSAQIRPHIPQASISLYEYSMGPCAGVSSLPASPKALQKTETPGHNSLTSCLQVRQALGYGR